MIDLTRMQPLVDRIVIDGSGSLGPITKITVEAVMEATSSRSALDALTDRVQQTLVHGMRVTGAETGLAVEAA